MINKLLLCERAVSLGFSLFVTSAFKRMMKLEVSKMVNFKPVSVIA